jgi:hypothetical protein
MLYLTYDNQALADGAGAQLQRIISIYLAAKFYKVGYIHQGLARMSYQGAKCLEDNTSDPRQMDDYNKAFALPSTPLLTPFTKIFKVYDISEENINELRDQPGNILLVIQFAGTMIDKKLDILLQPIPIPWTIRPTVIARPIVVAIHVRRGELFVVDSHRMLPNSYYVECMRALHTLFTQAAVPYEFHVHTEVLTKPTLVTPEHHGICSRTKEPVLVRPEDSHMEDFKEFTDCRFHINEYPIDTLKALTVADVLLASRSSFSYVASILKQGGVVLFHPFWHSLSPAWIPTEGGKDILDAKEKILNNLFKI